MIEENEELIPSAWILYKMGSIFTIWCILEVDENAALISSNEWVDEGVWIPLKTLAEDAELLGYGKYTYWRRFIPWARPFSNYED